MYDGKWEGRVERNHKPTTLPIKPTKIQRKVKEGSNINTSFQNSDDLQTKDPFSLKDTYVTNNFFLLSISN